MSRTHIHKLYSVLIRPKKHRVAKLLFRIADKIKRHVTHRFGTTETEEKLKALKQLVEVAKVDLKHRKLCVQKTHSARIYSIAEKLYDVTTDIVS